PRGRPCRGFSRSLMPTSRSRPPAWGRSPPRSPRKPIQAPASLAERVTGRAEEGCTVLGRRCLQHETADHLDDRLLHGRASLAPGPATPGLRGMIARWFGGSTPLMAFSAEGAVSLPNVCHSGRDGKPFRTLSVPTFANRKSPA